MGSGVDHMMHEPCEGSRAERLHNRHSTVCGQQPTRERIGALLVWRSVPSGLELQYSFATHLFARTRRSRSGFHQRHHYQLSAPRPSTHQGGVRAQKPASGLGCHYVTTCLPKGPHVLHSSFLHAHPNCILHYPLCTYSAPSPFHAFVAVVVGVLPTNPILQQSTNPFFVCLTLCGYRSACPCRRRSPGG
jgi:hypothetical protein